MSWDDTYTDAQIIAATLRNSDKFSALYDRHGVAVHRYVYRRVGWSIAEDLVAETFLSAFDRCASYDQSKPNALPWLYGIATRRIAMHWRAEAARYRVLARMPHEPAAHDMAERVIEDAAARADGARLAEALAGLSPGDRDVLLLIAWADLTYEEVAAALEIPVGTVRSRLHRARQATRQTLMTTAIKEQK